MLESAKFEGQVLKICEGLMLILNYKYLIIRLRKVNISEKTWLYGLLKTFSLYYSI